MDLSRLDALREQLEKHPVYAAVDGLPALRIFMTHHVYSVWDFMSLLKNLQQVVAPAGSPWLPVGDTRLRRFINELVMEEETDEAPGDDHDAAYASHFELYVQAMNEVGANTQAIQDFIVTLRHEGLDEALALTTVPAAARRFMHTTFGLIATGKPHVVAAALALGREKIIPPMFRALLAQMDIQERQAPRFHYYLERHIHLDDDFHAPMSLRLLESLCGGEPAQIDEALTAGRQAIEARLAFWDEVAAALGQAGTSSHSRETTS